MITLNTNEYEFCVPVGLNVRKDVLEGRRKPYYIECHIDKYHNFLNTLFVKSTLNRKYSQGDFIPLNTDMMVKEYGARYLAYIKEDLIDAGVIETNEVFTEDGKKRNLKGKESIGYRLTAKYQGKHVKWLQDAESTYIRNKRLGELSTVENMDWITKQSFFHLNDIGIRVETAVAYVDAWYQDKLLNIDTTIVREMDKKNTKRKGEHTRLLKAGKEVSLNLLTYTDMLDMMKESYLYQIKAVDEKTWLPIRDKKGLRIHSFLTNLWHKLRDFLYYIPNPDLQLVTLDCSNSQPFTLVKILFDYFNQCDDMPEDVQHYIDLVCAGELYKFLWLELGRDVTDAAFDKFKVDLFALVFYSKNEHGFDSQEAKMFRKYFPSVYQIIMSEKKFQYENLSIEMQRVETAAVLDGALTQLSQQYKDSVPFYSIHDAIVCPKEYEQEVRELMLLHYAAVVGVEPHIKPASNLNVVEMPETTSQEGITEHFVTSGEPIIMEVSATVTGAENPVFGDDDYLSMLFSDNTPKAATPMYEDFTFDENGDFIWIPVKKAG